MVLFKIRVILDPFLALSPWQRRVLSGGVASAGFRAALSCCFCFGGTSIYPPVMVQLSLSLLWCLLLLEKLQHRMKEGY